MIYLAQPYSSPDPKLRESRYLFALGITGALFQGGLNVYSPIVHWHVSAKLFQFPTDFAPYRELNEEMIRLSSAMYIALLPGLYDSEGVFAELRYALNNMMGLPISLVRVTSFNWQKDKNKLHLPNVEVVPTNGEELLEKFNGVQGEQRGPDARNDEDVFQ